MEEGEDFDTTAAIGVCTEDSQQRLVRSDWLMLDP